MKVHSLEIADSLYQFVQNEVLPGIDLDPAQFWKGFDALVNRLAPLNAQLLAERERLQEELDAWHTINRGPVLDTGAYRAFLQSIGYLLPVPEDFKILTENVDQEISLVAGPQLVVPASNARYVLNAANARWGSLYDALYGTDVIPQDGQAERKAGYDHKRRAKVVAYSKAFLDKFFPLQFGSHGDALAYVIADDQLEVHLKGGRLAMLESRDLMVGWQGEQSAPTSILLCHNRLHVELVIDWNSPIGKLDGSGLKDILLEAALSTIIDCEDSVAAVDADDKVNAYRNWLGLMKGDLTAEVAKAGSNSIRAMNPDKLYESPNGQVQLPGRSLLLVRNVGHLMTTPAVHYASGNEVPEGIVDGVVTSLIALHDLKVKRNSRLGSVYIVKPKMHGPEEVAFTDRLFGEIEDLISVPRNTLKMGIMDEERRTSLNLKACLAAASQRVAFINTGFLDRTGDEIHSSMRAGAMLRKGDMKSSQWLRAYERNNVAVGLDVGLRGRAQIGKGMWAMPDRMADMLSQKIAHPESGANTAWVPSPTAATPSCSALPRSGC